MKKVLIVFSAMVILVFGSIGIASAIVVNFDDIIMSSTFGGTRDHFENLGIQNTYAGLQWPNNTSNFGDNVARWAVVGNSDSQFSTVGAYSGSQAGWNFNDGTSMSIIFPYAVDVSGAFFNVFMAGQGWGADTVQFLGYNASNVLVGSSSVLSLDDVSNAPAWQWLSAGLNGITHLEIVATQDLTEWSSGDAWWAIDDLTYSPSAVPEPSTLILLASGLLGLGYFGRKKVKG